MLAIVLESPWQRADLSKGAHAAQAGVEVVRGYVVVRAHQVGQDLALLEEGLRVMRGQVSFRQHAKPVWQDG